MLFGVSTGVEVQRFVMVCFCFCLQSDDIIRSAGGLSKSPSPVARSATGRPKPQLPASGPFEALRTDPLNIFEYSTIK